MPKHDQTAPEGQRVPTAFLHMIKDDGPEFFRHGKLALFNMMWMQLSYQNCTNNLQAHSDDFYYIKKMYCFLDNIEHEELI